MEELEGERSRLEQEKQALEMQMERLTLQVGLGAREMFPAQTALLPAPVMETRASSYTTSLTWLRATAWFCNTMGLCHSGSLQGPLHALGSYASQHGPRPLFSLVLSPITAVSLWP